MLAMVEAMFGMFYVSLLIARLVSLYSFNSPLEAVNGNEIPDTKRSGSENPGGSRVKPCLKATTSSNSQRPFSRPIGKF